MKNYLLALGLASLFTSCGNSSEDTSPTTEKTATTFSAVNTIVQTNCAKSGCHLSPDGEHNINFSKDKDATSANYTQVSALVDTKTAADSSILVFGTGGSSKTKHGGQVVFTKTSSEYAAILAWIESGAKNE